MKRFTFKRASAMILAMLMVFSTANLSFVSFADPATMTTGQAVSIAYGDELNSAETALLESEYVIGDSISLTAAPVNTDGLIAVDPDAKTIDAQAKDEWVPVSAKIEYEGGFEDVALENGSGTFAYAGNNYTVRVAYSQKLTVNTDVQKKLLNAPYSLMIAYNNVSTLVSLNPLYKEIAANIDALYDEVSPYAENIGDDVMMAIEDFAAEASANEGVLDISNYLDQFEDTAYFGGSITRYMTDTAGCEEMLNAASITADRIATICGSDAFAVLAAQNEDIAAVLSVFNSIMTATNSIVSDVSWSANASAVLVPGINDPAAADALIAAVAESGLEAAHDENLVTAEITIGTADVFVNFDRCTVSVTIDATVLAGIADSGATTALPTYTGSAILDADASSADIEAVVASVEADALAFWESDYAVNETNYVRSVSAIPASLTEDVTVAVSYAPRYFTISGADEIDGIDSSLPYGYILTLPVLAGTTESVWDYTVNGELYFQGSVVKIVGDTAVSRTENTPWEFYSLNKIVGGAYSDVLNESELAIINSDSIYGDTVNAHLPKNGATVKYDGMSGEKYKYTINIPRAVNSGYGSKKWQPASFKAVDAAGNVLYSKNSVSTANNVFYTTEEIDHVEVIYNLPLDVSADARNEIINKADAVVAQAASNLAEMDELNAEYNNIGKLDKDTMNKIVSAMQIFDFTDEAKAAAKRVKAQCFDTNGYMYIYNYLNEYRANGLTALYYDGVLKNLVKQIAILKDDLNTIYSDPALDDVLKLAVSNPDSYKSDLNRIVTTLNGIDLAAPDAYIDTYGEDINALIADIGAAIGNTSGHNADTRKINITETITVPAPNKAVVTFVVKKADGNGKIISSTSYSKIVAKGATVSEADAAEFAAMAATGIDAEHYTVEGVAISEGDVIDNNISRTFIWSPASYTVNFNGVNLPAQTFKYDIPTITLPASADSRYNYEYTIGDTTITVGGVEKVYTFRNVNADTFPGNAYTINVTKIDVYGTETKDFIDELNQAAVDAGLVYDAGNGKNGVNIAFIPVKNGAANGGLEPAGASALDINDLDAIVLRVSPNGSVNTVKKYVKKVAEHIATFGFDYIKLNDEYIREGSKISLQGAIDAIVKTGFGFDTVKTAINPNGTINENFALPAGSEIIDVDENGYITVSGNNVIANLDQLGAEIAVLSLNFAESTSDPGKTITLYLTLEDFGQKTSSLKKIRDAVDKVDDYVDISFDNDNVNITVDLPDRAYQAYMTYLLGLGYTDIAAIGNGDKVKVLDWLVENMTALVSDSRFTAATIDNTLDKVGSSQSVSQYSKYFDDARTFLKGVLENSEFNADYTNDHVMISEFLDYLDVDEDLRKIIKEKNTGVDVPLNITIVDHSAEYEAAIIDLSANGFDNQAYYTKDLASASANLHDNSIVVLLNDVNANLVFTSNTVLDLNGKTVNGSITSGKALRIIDSTLDTNAAGTVTGSINGDVTITAGVYAADVTSKLDPNYVQDSNGAVHSAYYTISTSGGDININLICDDQDIKAITTDDGNDLAVEIAATLLINNYAAAAMAIDGNTIYSFSYDDLVSLIDSHTATEVNEILDMIDCAGISAFANDLIGQLTDFAAVASAIEADTPIATFEVSKSGWTLEADIVGSGNNAYITANVGGAEETTTRTVNVFWNDYAELQELYADLANTTTITSNVSLDDLSYANQTITATASGSVAVDIDFTNDINYAVAMATIIAYATDDADLSAAMVNGINDYYENGSHELLKEAFDNAVMGDLAAALAAINTNVTFADMLTALDITADARAEELYGYYDLLVNTLAFAERKTDYGVDNTDLFGDYEGDYGVYTHTTNGSANGSANFLGSYKVAGDFTATSISVTLRLFPEEFTVIYKAGTDAAGADYADPNNNYAFGATVTLDDGTNAVFTRDGYILEGWTTEDGGSKEYELGGTYTHNADNDGAEIIFYPAWVECTHPTYTVTYDAEQGKYFATCDVCGSPYNGFVSFEQNGQTEYGYAVDGELVYYGLYEDPDTGYVYYIDSTCLAIRSDTTDHGVFKTIPEDKTNGVRPAGLYEFDSDCHMMDKEGLIYDWDGYYRYYEEDRAVYKGLVYDGGYYYYINSSLTAVKSTNYAIGANKTNGLKPAGTYEFDEYCHMVIKNGLYEEGDDLVYYEDSVPVAKGLIRIMNEQNEADYYYIGEGGKAVKNTTIELTKDNNNGLLPFGLGYEFGSDGKLIYEEDPHIQVDGNGVVRYIVDGEPQYQGLVRVIYKDGSGGDYYYFNSYKKAVQAEDSNGTRYGVSESRSNGLVRMYDNICDVYWFDENGKMIQKDGFVLDPDGEYRYYDHYLPRRGLAAVENAETGETDIYFFGADYLMVKNQVVKVSSTLTNGVLDPGTYKFGPDGKLVPKNGLVFCEDGEVRYYVDDVPQYQGLVKYIDPETSEVSYYYINSEKKAVKNTYYQIGESKANFEQTGLHAGRYYFDADGKLVDNSSKSGITFDPDGQIRYYENGEAVYKGLVYDDVNDCYYYFNSSRTAVKSTNYRIGANKTNGLLPEGIYAFGADGKLVIGG